MPVAGLEDLAVRKVSLSVEDLHRDGRDASGPAARTVVALIVLRNPWAGSGYVEDLGDGVEVVAPRVGAYLAKRATDAAGAPIEAYGKAAVVGLDGELEHASALIHTLAFGDPLRQAVGGRSLLPAVEKRAPAGASFDIPLKHVDDATTRSHHQTATVAVADAPGLDEILIALAIATSGRLHARLPAFPGAT
jgi:hypothetical protein